MHILCVKYTNTMFWQGAGLLTVPKTALAFLPLSLCSCYSLHLAKLPPPPPTSTGRTASSPSGLGKCHLTEPFPDHLIQNRALGVPHCGSVVMNKTSIHDNADSIPGLAQWVKDLVLP